MHCCRVVSYQVNWLNDALTWSLVTQHPVIEQYLTARLHVLNVATTTHRYTSILRASFALLP